MILVDLVFSNGCHVSFPLRNLRNVPRTCCSATLSMRLSREYSSLPDIEERTYDISVAESELSKSLESLSEAISGFQGTMSFN